MKRFIRFALLCVLCCPLVCVAAKKTSPLHYAMNTLNLPQGLDYLINHTRKKAYSNFNIGIVVQSLKTKKVLYSYHADQLFTPASIQKLFTATAALYFLKPSFHFVTSVLSNGRLANGTLKGNIYVKFSGDPQLTSADLATLFADLRRFGVTKITGHIYIDNTDYNNIPYPPGWIWDDLSYSYAAPMNAIIIDSNKFILQFKPAKTLGAKPTLSTSLPVGVVQFINHSKTTKNYVKKCPIAIYSNNQNVYGIEGCLPQRFGTQRRSLAVRDIVRYAKAEIADQLKQNGIRYTGRIAMAKTPKNARALAVHESPPLSKIVKEMLKESDNLTTNAVFKKIGEQYFKKTGSWQNSLMAVKKILAKPAGINFKQNLLNDGAGLSRYNLVKPDQLLKLLNFIDHTPRVRNALLPALPIAGKDGTLIARMLTLGRDQRVHAKTGSMTGVSSLAGFARTKRNGTLAFVIMVNNFVGKRAPYIKLENNICRFLVNARRS